MSDKFISLTCQSCGAKLDVYDDMTRFACSYCGAEMVVQRRGGTVALKAIEAAIQKVQVGTDKTAAELALVRLKEDYANLRSGWEAEKKRMEIEESGCLGGLLDAFGKLSLAIGGLLFVTLPSQKEPDAGWAIVFVVVGVILMYLDKLVSEGPAEKIRKKQIRVEARLREISTEIQKQMDILNS